MLTSHCRNCGAAKTDYVALTCTDCEKLSQTRMDEFAKANPEASQSDILYAGRQALGERAHSAHKNLVDPRLHSRHQGSKFIAGR